MKVGYKIILRFLAAIIIALCALLYFYYNRSCIVSFNTGGGTIYQSISVKANESFSLPSNPALDGYIFEGWIDEDTGEDYTEGMPIVKNTMLKAKWKAI